MVRVGIEGHAAPLAPARTHRNKPPSRNFCPPDTQAIERLVFAIQLFPMKFSQVFFRRCRVGHGALWGLLKNSRGRSGSIPQILAFLNRPHLKFCEQGSRQQWEQFKSWKFARQDLDPDTGFPLGAGHLRPRSGEKLRTLTCLGVGSRESEMGSSLTSLRVKEASPIL